MLVIYIRLRTQGSNCLIFSLDSNPTHLNPENGGSVFFRTFAMGTQVEDYTAQHRRLQFKYNERWFKVYSDRKC
jgi:hypothetical protein